jgi:5-methylcytosine-specific restriction endonuclease McrA
MNGRQRRPTIKLSPDLYASMRNLVLERDGWRCQECGAFYNLQVHHLQPRSKLGSDTLETLSLCVPIATK